MTREEWMETIEARFFDIITRGSNNRLNDLVDCAYSFLCNPILVVNERGEILGKAQQNAPYNDALWEEFDQKGYVPREKYQYLNATQHPGLVENNKVIIFDPSHISHRLMLYQTRLSSHFLLRAVILESKRPFSKDDEEILTLFAKTAGYYLQDFSLVRNFNSSSLEFFLHELINGHIDVEHNEREILSYFGIEKGDRMLLLVVQATHTEMPSVSLYEARVQLQSIFCKSTAFIYNEQIVLFVKLREQAGELAKRFAVTESYLRGKGLCAGVSRYFDSFQHISDYYRITSNILSMGISNNIRGALYYTGDLLVTYLLRSLSAEQMEACRYLPMLELFDSDKRKGTEYLPTLYAYVIALGSITKAARLLGVHYNTMKYRVQHMEKILGQNMKEVLPALYLSLKVLFLTKKDDMGKCFDLELHYHKVRGMEYEQ